MTNMEIPSVSLYIEYSPMHDAYKITAMYEHGGQSVKAGYQLGLEQLVNAYNLKSILHAVVEEMAFSLVKYAPWISYEWMVARLLEKCDSLAESIENNKSEFFDVAKVTYPKDYVSDKSSNKNLSSMANGLPGMKTSVEYPCECSYAYLPQTDGVQVPVRNRSHLKEVIMHINDVHAEGGDVWSSDRLCDWLDMLHDTGVVNLEVEIPDKEIK